MERTGRSESDPYRSMGPSHPWIVIVNGPPAAGKTTFARSLAGELRLPLFTKDDIKESLFDTLGFQDREWSRKLGLASLVLLFELVERQIEVGRW